MTTWKDLLGPKYYKRFQEISDAEQNLIAWAVKAMIEALTPRSPEEDLDAAIQDIQDSQIGFLHEVDNMDEEWRRRIQPQIDWIIAEGQRALDEIEEIRKREGQDNGNS